MPTASTPAFWTSPRWRRLLRWCFWLGVICVLCLGIAGYWLSQNQTPVVNSLLVRLAPELGASVGKVQVTPSQITLHDVVLRSRDNAEDLLHLPELSWQPAWSSMRQGQLGTIILKDVVLDLTTAKLKQLLTLSNGSAKSDTKGPSTTKIAALELHNVRVKTSGSGMPTAEFLLDQKAAEIDFTDPLHPHVRSFTTMLREVKIASGDGLQTAVTIPSLQLVGSLSRGDGIVRIDSLKVGASSVAITPTLLGNWQRWINPEPPSDSPVPAKAAVPALAWFKGVHIHDIDFDNVSLSALADAVTPTPTWWPNVKGNITCHLSDLDWTPNSGLRLGPQKMVLKNIELRPPTGVGRLAAREFSILIDGMTDDGLVNVQQAVLDVPIIEWTPELERYLVPVPISPPAPHSLHPSVDEPPHKPIVRAINGVLLHRFQLRSGQASTRPTALIAYTTSAGLEGEAEDLRLTSEGATSSKSQSLRLRDLKVTEPLPSRSTPPEPFAELASAVLRIVPDVWNAGQGITELTVVKPIVRARADTTRWFEPIAESATPSVTDKPGKASPWWLNKLHFDKLQVTEGSIDFANAASPRIDARTSINITTETTNEGPLHRIRWDKIQGNLPEHAALPIASIDSVEVAVQWPQILTSKRLNELSIKGAELDINEALMTLLAGPSPPTEATEIKSSEAAHPLAGWRINKLSIADTAITLHRIAPGLPPVKFDIDYDALDMPLAPAELAGNFQSQRVELSQLAIRSPYNSRHEVMRMDTIFVNFTLDGLLARRIDKVEVISPTVYIGEDLFWYVDYYRKYAAGEPLPDAPIDRIALAATDNIAALQAATDLASKPVKEGVGWTVDTLQVTGGKLVIAPKGTPLPGIPRPFPFSFTTKMNQGHIIADLDIPEDTYTWEQMKLQLERMRGRVQFNLPIKSRDNNLNEVFRIDRIRYKKLHVEEAHLSITYDVNGIYGQFGGQAYEGYVNGAFNVYLDDSFTWDGWISGTGVKTTEITEQLCPAYFMLDGKVDLTVIAQGDEDEVYQSDIKFKNASPGKFSIQALNDLTSSLPADSASYSRDIMRIGVETLRDFEYDKVDGTARFFGREGKGYLKFSGPHGSRNFDINVYDHRMQIKKNE